LPSASRNVVMITSVAGIRPVGSSVAYGMSKAALNHLTVLLAKAKHTRPKDEADFSNTVATLSAAEKRWLSDAIAQVHPGHRWLGEIGG